MQTEFSKNNSNVTNSTNLRIASDGFKTLAKNFEQAVTSGNVAEVEAALKGLHSMIAFARTFLDANTNPTPWKPTIKEEE